MDDDVVASMMVLGAIVLVIFGAGFLVGGCCADNYQQERPEKITGILVGAKEGKDGKCLHLVFKDGLQFEVKNTPFLQHFGHQQTIHYRMENGEAVVVKVDVPQLSENKQ